jgi:hypothetical protein
MRVEEAQSDEQLSRDLNFLTPVQRAQFFMMARRFEERLRMIREQRPRQGEAPMRGQPGGRTGPGPMGLEDAAEDEPGA